MASYLVPPTGFWIFFCNPRIWPVDRHLRDHLDDLTWAVMPYQAEKQWISIGDRGVIRVGHDDRTVAQRDGRPKLQRGVYALVRVSGAPQWCRDKEDEWHEYDPSQVDHGKKTRWRVSLAVTHDLLDRPIKLTELGNVVWEWYLLNGFRGSSIPMKAETFQSVQEIAEQRR